jgi:hypothetical protein
MTDSSTQYDTGGAHPVVGLLLSLTITLTVAVALGALTMTLASAVNALVVQIVVAVVAAGVVLYFGVGRDGPTAPTQLD